MEELIGFVDGVDIMLSHHVKFDKRNGRNRQGNLKNSCLAKIINDGLRMARFRTASPDGNYHIKTTRNGVNIGVVVSDNGNHFKVVTIIIQKNPIFKNKTEGSVFNIPPIDGIC
jgi:hypothetical protein